MIHTYTHHTRTNSRRLDIDSQQCDQKTPTGRCFSLNEDVLFCLVCHPVMMLNNTIRHEIYWNSCFNQLFTKNDSKSQSLEQQYLLVGVFWSSQTKRFAKTENTLWKRK